MKKILSIMAALAILSFTSSLIEAWTCYTIWNWFAADLGQISFQAWYGITNVLGIIIAVALTNISTQDSKEKSHVMRVINTGVNITLTCLFVLGITGLIGLITGWI